jgi:hypothetical protein
MTQADLERALQAVLAAEQQRYVALLNAYLRALQELAALRAEPTPSAQEEDR